jgi:hypothetical protein
LISNSYYINKKINDHIKGKIQRNKSSYNIQVKNMSGAQGAQPKESKTATTYESIDGGQNRTRTDLLSKEDQGSIQVDKLEEKVHDPAGKGGPVFGAGKDDNKQDLGLTGTG